MIKFYRDAAPTSDWRNGVWTCPSCDYGTRGEHDAWLQSKQVIAVYLSTGIRWSKHGSVIIESECPKCFAKSWNHQTLNGIRGWAQDLFGWPKDAVLKLELEYTTRIAQGQRDWRKSLCFKCSVKRAAIFNYIYPHVDCSAGIHGRVRTECKLFKPKPGPGRGGKS